MSRLRSYRLANDYTLEDVSGITGASVAMLSLLERGKRQASPRMRVQIARRLGVPVAEVFDVEPLEEDDLGAA